MREQQARTDVVVEPEEGADEFAVGAHDDPDGGSDALVDHLKRENGAHAPCCGRRGRRRWRGGS